MCHRFQVKNLVISVATFIAGVALASALETDAPRFTDPQPSVRTETSLTCVDIEETVPNLYRVHTEREAALRDQIRVTEKELLDIKTRSVINTPGVGRDGLSRQDHLEARLVRLLYGLKVLQEDVERRSAPRTKLILRQVCQER